MKNFKTIEEAVKKAIEKTNALRVIKTTDGANLEATGYDFFGNACFNIYKSYTSQYNKIYIVRYPNN